MTETETTTQEEVIVSDQCLRCQKPRDPDLTVTELYAAFCLDCQHDMKHDAEQVALHSHLTNEEAQQEEIARLLAGKRHVMVIETGWQKIMTLGPCLTCGRRGIQYDGECLQCSVEALNLRLALKNEDLELLRSLKHQERIRNDLRHQRDYLMQHIEALQARLYRINQALEETA